MTGTAADMLMTAETVPIWKAGKKTNFVRKTRAIKSGKMIFVGPSQWSVDCAGKSRITEGQRIVRILNPVNRDVFYRRDNIPMLKKKYGIPADRKIILFGATQADNNKIKGMQYLDEALCGLSEREYAVVIFGNQGGVRLTNDKLEVRCLGPVKQEDELAEIYKFLRYHGVFALLLESSAKEKIDGEFRVIIDNDLCEIIA